MAPSAAPRCRSASGRGEFTAPRGAEPDKTKYDSENLGDLKSQVQNFADQFTPEKQAYCAIGIQAPIVNVLTGETSSVGNGDAGRMTDTASILSTMARDSCDNYQSLVTGIVVINSAPLGELSGAEDDTPGTGGGSSDAGGSRAQTKTNLGFDFDEEGTPVNREIVIVAASQGVVDKGGYRHFMEKEIHEQPDAIAHTLAAMTGPDGKLSTPLAREDLAAIDGIVMLAAGTSHYAAMVARYWIESLARVPVSCEIASEYRYRKPVTGAFSCAVAISQSGESLDTLMAMRHAGEAGLRTIGLVNVPGSTIAREADMVMPTRAGPEIGVASTKAFTAQLTALISFAVALAEAKGQISVERRDEIHAAIQGLPSMVGRTLGLFDDIRPLAHSLTAARSALYLGRDVLFPVALEGALKLKELSYIHAEGFASGEMKHGPIALIEEGLPVVALLAADEVMGKAASNLQEAAARGGRIILITEERAASTVDFAESVITVPNVDPLLAPVLLTVPVQILAYLTAFEKGTDVDQPRNLAKSVTVE